MKRSLKILVGSMAIAALTACGGGGGGGGSTDPNAVGVVGAYGANQTQMNVGYGVWSGNIIGQNVGSQQYQMFMYQYGSGSYSTLINLRVWTKQSGIIPDQMGFAINRRNSGGDAFANGNGFIINNYGFGGYGGGYGYGGYPGGQIQCFSYPCQPVNMQQGQPMIQITTQYTEPCHNTMNVQIRFQNVIVASGQITSERPVQFSNYFGGYPFGYPGQANTMAQVPQQCYMMQQQMQQPNNYYGY